jgi:hypothetical protein
VTLKIGEVLWSSFPPYRRQQREHLKVVILSAEQDQKKAMFRARTLVGEPSKVDNFLQFRSNRKLCVE